jgi:hypothetical protein
MTSAPDPANESDSGSGGSGVLNFAHAVQRVAIPGTSRMPASAIPRRARFLAVQLKSDRDQQIDRKRSSDALLQ